MNNWQELRKRRSWPNPSMISQSVRCHGRDSIAEPEEYGLQQRSRTNPLGNIRQFIRKGPIINNYKSRNNLRDKN
jgi:hypothetical protein